MKKEKKETKLYSLRYWKSNACVFVRVCVYVECVYKCVSISGLYVGMMCSFLFNTHFFFSSSSSFEISYQLKLIAFLLQQRPGPLWWWWRWPEQWTASLPSSAALNCRMWIDQDHQLTGNIRYFLANKQTLKMLTNRYETNSLGPMNIENALCAHTRAQTNKPSRREKLLVCTSKLAE